MLIYIELDKKKALTNMLRLFTVELIHVSYAHVLIMNRF